MTLNNLYSYIALMRLDKPIGMFLLLWPTWWALLIAGNGKWNTKVNVVFTLGVLLMRAAGCVINDIADRDFDGHVARTRLRPLACGALSVNQALIVFMMLLCSAGLLVLTLDILTIGLSLIAALLAVIYPFMKRITFYPQIVLGLAFSWSIPMVFSAVQHTLVPEIIGWFAATMLWIIAYDTQYAMADRADDQKIGLKSTALAFGNLDTCIIFLLQNGFLCLMIIMGAIKHFGFWYYLGLLLAFFVIIQQQYLIKERKSAECFKAFLLNNYVGGLIFLGLLLEFQA